MIKNNLKTKIGIFFCVCMLVIAGLPFTNSNTTNGVHAYSNNVTITNGDFESYSGSGYPKSANTWATATGSSTASLIKGVVNTSKSTLDNYSDEYGLSSIPENIGFDANNDAYLINALKTKQAYGIKSGSFTLSNNSYYILSVEVATNLNVLVGETSEQIGSTAAIYLNNNKDEVIASKLNINTSNNWNTIHFFIKTNQLENINANVELWLGNKGLDGSNGAVMFDNVKLTEYDEVTYNERVNSLYNPTSDVKVDKSIPQANIFNSINTTFNAITGWTLSTNKEGKVSNLLSGVTKLGNEYSEEITGGIINPGTYGSAEGAALFVNALDKNGAVYSSESFTIEVYKNYKVSLYVKTGNINGEGARIALVPENAELTASEFTNVTSSTNAITNNWTKYTFYVQGNTINDERLHFELGLASEETLGSGYAFFSGIEVYEIDNVTYSDASTSNNVKKLSLLPSTSNTSALITNGYFNQISNTSLNAYPFAPASWTQNNEDNNISGIINTNKTHFNAYKDKYGDGNLDWNDIEFTPSQHAQNENSGNNILMLYANANWASYTSASVKMESGSYYKLTTYVKTLGTTVATVKATSGTKSIIANFDVTSNDEWATVTAYISTGYSSKNMVVTLGLGSQNNLTTGYAFFDNVVLTKITEDKFALATNGELTKVVDFTKENFDIFTGETDGSLNQYNVPANWTLGVTDNNGNAIDRSTINLEAGVQINEDGNVLTVGTDAKATVTYTSDFNYSLDSTKYYKVTFCAKADANIKLGAVEDNENYLTNVTESTITSDYVNYTMYIYSAKITTLTPYICLTNNGGEWKQVYLNKFTFEEITEDDYLDAKEEFEANENSIKNIVFLENSSEDTTENENTSKGEFNFSWYYVPTIITALALIAAIIGIIIKRGGKKTTSIKHISNYDRKKTMHSTLIKREAEIRRNEQIKTYSEALKEKQEEIKLLEQEYKELSKNVEGNATQQKYMSYARKHARLAKEISVLQDKLNYLNSELFITDEEKTIATDIEKGKELEVDKMITQNDNTQLDGASNETNQDE